MKIVNPKTGVKYYVDGYLVQIMEVIKKRIEKLGKDSVIIIDGLPGSGKSTLGVCLCCWNDPDFTYNQIHFSGESFEKGLREGKDYMPEQFDEAHTALKSKDWYNFINKRLAGIMDVIRYKHKPIFIISPSVFSLDKDLVLSRVTALIHCYSKGEKFFWHYYNRKQLKMIILKGYKHRSYNVVQPYCWGHLYKKFGHLDYKVYEGLKKKEIDEYLDNMDKKGIRKDLDINKDIEIAMKLRKEGYSLRDIGRIINKNHSTIGDWLAKQGDSLGKTDF